MTTTALLVAFVADVLLSRRFVLAAARQRVRHLRNHVIVVGLARSASAWSATWPPPDTTSR